MTGAAHAIAVDLLAVVSIRVSRRMRVAADATDFVAGDAVGLRSLIVAARPAADVPAGRGSVKVGRAGSAPTTGMRIARICRESSEVLELVAFLAEASGV